MVPSAPVPPRIRAPRPKRYYRNKSKREVGAKLRSAKWHGLYLLPDICRIASGKCQIAFLLSVYFHTENEPHNIKDKKWKAKEYAPVMLPGDYADESGFSRPSMIEAQEDAVRRGLVARMRETGRGRHRWKLLFKDKMLHRILSRTADGPVLHARRTA
jgi:hypothetical protein